MADSSLITLGIFSLSQVVAIVALFYKGGRWTSRIESRHDRTDEQLKQFVSQLDKLERRLDEGKGSMCLVNSSRLKELESKVTSLGSYFSKRLNSASLSK